MRTWTKYLADVAKQCNVNISDTTSMSLIGSNINDSINTICNIQGGKLRFLEATKDMHTVASQETYQIPNGFRKLIDIMVYSDTGVDTHSTIYSPEMVFDPTKWKRVLQYRLGEGDVPYFTYVENKTYKIQPIPASTGNLIRLRGRLQIRDLSISDYTTGTITSIANGGTAMVGASTVWTADMAGRYIQITETTTSGGGDGFWYEIASVQSATTLTLTKPYEGTTITGATAAYTIGQCSVIPPAYDVGVVQRATALWWDNQNDLVRGKVYWMKYDGGMEAGYSKDYGGLMLQMLSNEGETEEGSYIPPFATSSNLPFAPYYQPFQDASGMG